MTLLELLVKELPDKGGWPEGWKSMVQGSDTGCLYRDGGICRSNSLDLSLPVASDSAQADVTKEQYESALAAYQSEYWKGRVMNEDEWSGEGLPPVGVLCQVYFQTDNHPEWYDFTLQFLGKEHAIAIVGGEEICYQLWRLTNGKAKFRPIRTEAERRREDAVVALAVAAGCLPDRIGERLDGGQVIGSDWFDVYDAIAAGKIPGVKLEDS